MSFHDTHEAGLDILGADKGIGLSDFVPWLGVVGKLASGLAGGASGPSPEDQKAAIQKAIEAQKQKEALAKAQAEAARSKMLLYATVGVIGAGLLTFTVVKLAGKKR